MITVYDLTNYNVLKHIVVSFYFNLNWLQIFSKETFLRKIPSRKRETNSLGQSRDQRMTSGPSCCKFQVFSTVATFKDQWTVCLESFLLTNDWHHGTWVGQFLHKWQALGISKTIYKNNLILSSQKVNELAIGGSACPEWKGSSF